VTEGLGGVRVAVDTVAVVTDVGWTGEDEGGADDLGVTVADVIEVMVVVGEPAAFVVVAVTDVVTTTVEY
jgi:hypothetical protein